MARKAVAICILAVLVAPVCHADISYQQLGDLLSKLDQGQLGTSSSGTSQGSADSSSTSPQQQSSPQQQQQQDLGNVVSQYAPQAQQWVNNALGSQGSSSQQPTPSSSPQPSQTQQQPTPSQGTTIPSSNSAATPSPSASPTGQPTAQQLNSWQRQPTAQSSSPAQAPTSAPTSNPSSSPSASSGQCSTRIPGSDPLQLHNQYRAKHGAGALSWDAKLAADAQAWVDKLSSSCQFYHSGSGENLAAGFQNWEDVIWAWYSECSKYRYDAPGYSSATGHFTQVLWAGSQRLGCAYSKPNCGQGIVWACHYDPPGNVNTAQYFQNNVFRLQ